jgi:hypothetical protein
MAHRRISQDMLWKFLVQHFLEDGLAGVVKFCGHLGAMTAFDFFFLGHVKNIN